jgi:uncharacterized protein
MRSTTRIVASALMALVLAGAPGRADLAPGRTPEVAPPVQGPQEAEVVAVVVDPRTQTHSVLLQGKRDRRQLAMTIGLAEATGIAVPLHGVTPPRPLTHDLVLTLMARLKVSVSRVVITDLRDDIYYATLHLHGSTGDLALDSRPSDAIALAIRAKAPVLIEDRVFDKGGSVEGQPARRPHI